MNKLNPNIKLGCPICQSIKNDDFDIKSSFNIVMPSKKITLVKQPIKKSSKVISLF